MLGLREDMSIEQARAMLASYRAQLKEKRKSSADRAYSRWLNIKRLNSLWLPVPVVKDFEQQAMTILKMDARHWAKAQDLIASITVDPEEWTDRPELLYAYFLKNRYSIDYTQRILRIVNAYMQRYCRKTKRSWLPIPMPPKAVKKDLNKNKRRHTEAFPLFEQDLVSAKKVFSEEEFLGLEISYFFGLRPQEVKQIRMEKEGTSWFVKGKSLWVLQKKIAEMVNEERAWKELPCKEPEQERILLQLRSQKGYLPHNRKFKLVNPKLTQRSGRAGFYALMYGRGHSDSDISLWMGHQDLRQTRVRYRKLIMMLKRAA